LREKKEEMERMQAIVEEFQKEMKKMKKDEVLPIHHISWNDYNHICQIELLAKKEKLERNLKESVSSMKSLKQELSQLTLQEIE
jgi:hypothetical protein